MLCWRSCIEWVFILPLNQEICLIIHKQESAYQDLWYEISKDIKAWEFAQDASWRTLNDILMRSAFNQWGAYIFASSKRGLSCEGKHFSKNCTGIISFLKQYFHALFPPHLTFSLLVLFSILWENTACIKNAFTVEMI